MLSFIPFNVKHTSPLNLPLEFDALEGRKHVLLIFMSLRVSGVVFVQRGPKRMHPETFKHCQWWDANNLINWLTPFYNDILFFPLFWPEIFLRVDLGMALIPEGMGRPTQPFGQWSNPGAQDRSRGHRQSLLPVSPAPVFWGISFCRGTVLQISKGPDCPESWVLQAKSFYCFTCSWW